MGLSVSARQSNVDVKKLDLQATLASKRLNSNAIKMYDLEEIGSVNINRSQAQRKTKNISSSAGNKQYANPISPLNEEYLCRKQSVKSNSLQLNKQFNQNLNNIPDFSLHVVSNKQNIDNESYLKCQKKIKPERRSKIKGKQKVEQ